LLLDSRRFVFLTLPLSVFKGCCLTGHRCFSSPSLLLSSIFLPLPQIKRTFTHTTRAYTSSLPLSSILVFTRFRHNKMRNRQFLLLRISYSLFSLPSLSHSRTNPLLLLLFFFFPFVSRPSVFSSAPFALSVVPPFASLPSFLSALLSPLLF